jgi:hypothetical protein
MQQHTSEAFAAFVGLDGAAAQHAVCLQAAGTAPREVLSLEPRPEEIHAWGQTLRTRCNGPPVAVCLERTTGPSVSALRHDDCLVLFPLHPLTVAKSREAFTPSRANDDPTEAERQGEILLPHRDKLTPLRPQRPPRRALAHLVEHRRRLGGDTVRLTHRLPRARKNDFPQVLPWFPAQDTAIFGAFLSRWPTRKAAHLARRTPLEGCCRAHHVRSADVLTTRIAASQSARVLPTAAGVMAPHVLRVQALVAPRRGTFQAMADVATAIAQRAQDHPDLPWFAPLPGAGAVCAPRLLVAFGAQRERFPSADELQKYAGIAPGTARSGTKAWVHWRLQWPKFLRQTFGEWAAASTRHAFWAQGSYQQQRAKGKAHQAAVRALAFTGLRILSRCWQDRTPDDASVYLPALNRRSASLLYNLANEAYKGVKKP